jgi:hypothetical protein
MNAKVGNVAKGQVQIIKNNPFTLWKGIYEWVSTYVMNEKNAEWISRRVQNDLDGVDLTRALTVDWADKGQYWLCVGKKIWILNYRTDTWYILELPDTPTCFCLVGDKLYFGTTAGQIMRFDETLATFNGTNIEAVWEMGYFNFGVEWLRKFIQRLFLSIQCRIDFCHKLRIPFDRRPLDLLGVYLLGLDGYSLGLKIPVGRSVKNICYRPYRCISSAININNRRGYGSIINN